MKLADELKEHGSDMEPDAFNDTIQELRAALAPALNAEQLLYQPTEALKFCRAVRARCGRRLPDEMILRRLNNLRKSQVPA